MIELPERVKVCELTKEKTDYIWDRVKVFDQIFPLSTRWNKEEFFKKMYSRENVILEIDEGLIFFENFYPELYTQMQLTFWDKHLSTRIELIKECIVWIFLEFNLQRIEILIPEFARAIRRIFEKKLNFKYEGRLRNRMWYKGQSVDVLIFSILQQEVK